MSKEWYVYLVRCSDNSLYCGVTIDLNARICAHNTSTRGAKYTRSRRPVTLVWAKKMPNKSKAFQEECRIKKMKKIDKEKLVDNFNVNNCNFNT